MTWLLRSCIVVGLILMAVAGGAAAETPALTGVLKDRLAALDHLAGADLYRADLDDRVVVVTFFASWCPPCHLEFEHLNALHDEYADDGILVVAVNLFENHGRFKDSGGRLARFIAKFHPAFAVIEGDDGIAAAFGGVDRIPTMFIFGRDGAPALHFVHERGAKQTNPDIADVEAAIRKAR